MATAKQLAARQRFAQMARNRSNSRIISQPQYPSQPQNSPQEMFKGGTGQKPYPVVAQQGLAPSNTYRDYVMTSNMFTGERTWVKRPEAERWIRPK